MISMVMMPLPEPDVAEQVVAVASTTHLIFSAKYLVAVAAAADQFSKTSSVVVDNVPATVPEMEQTCAMTLK